MSNAAAKKLKASSDEGGASVQQNSDSEEVDSGFIINADGSETGGKDENETAVSGQGTERRTPYDRRVAVVPEDYPDVKMAVVPEDYPDVKMAVVPEDYPDVKMAVVPEDYPDVKMTEEQAEVVEAALVESIWPNDRGPPIQFSETRYENGALVFTCVNGRTHRWLRVTAQKMVPWPGARLEVRQAQPTLTGRQLVVWVNHTMGVGKRSYEQILELIQKQNKGVSTAEWKVVRGVAETDGNERLVLWVDNRSFEDLKACNFKLFLGLSQAKFLKMSEYKKLHSGPPADQNPPRPSASELPSLLSISVSRPVYGYRGPAHSPQNPRSHSHRFERRDLPQSRELASVDTHLRGAQFTGVVASGERMYTNRESSFPDSQQLRSRGFSAAERSPEASYDRREPRYVQERGYSASYRR